MISLDRPIRHVAALTNYLQSSQLDSQVPENTAVDGNGILIPSSIHIRSTVCRLKYIISHFFIRWTRYLSRRPPAESGLAPQPPQHPLKLRHTLNLTSTSTSLFHTIIRLSFPSSQHLLIIATTTMSSFPPDSHAPTPPILPPKPSSQEPSRIGTPTSGAPPPPPSSLSEAGQQYRASVLSSAAAGAGAAAAATPPLPPPPPPVSSTTRAAEIPDPGDQWLPQVVQDKSCVFPL